MRQIMNEISRRAALGLGAAAGVGVLLSAGARAAQEKRRVIIWSEGTEPANVYPDGIRGAIAQSLKSLEGWEIITRTITDDAQGVPEEDLTKTDVLMWWGHKRHNEVKDETVDRIVKHVKENGMGFIALHSSHFARPYKRLMNTACSWSHYVDDGAPTRIFVLTPKHPIAHGVEDFDIPHMERYGEPFRCPEPPKATIFGGIATMKNGDREFARQGLLWIIGKGRVFYFQPGHETYPIFYQKEVQQIMRNAVQYCAPERGAV
jgi:trehalose utilization protein